MVTFRNPGLIQAANSVCYVKLNFTPLRYTRIDKYNLYASITYRNQSEGVKMLHIRCCIVLYGMEAATLTINTMETEHSRCGCTEEFSESLSKY